MKARVLKRDYGADEMKRGDGMTFHPVTREKLAQLFFDTEQMEFFTQIPVGYGNVTVLCLRRPAINSISLSYCKGEPYPADWLYDPFSGEPLMFQFLCTNLEALSASTCSAAPVREVVLINREQGARLYFSPENITYLKELIGHLIGLRGWLMSPAIPKDFLESNENLILPLLARYGLEERVCKGNWKREEKCGFCLVFPAKLTCSWLEAFHAIIASPYER